MYSTFRKNKFQYKYPFLEKQGYTLYVFYILEWAGL